MLAAILCVSCNQTSPVAQKSPGSEATASPGSVATSPSQATASPGPPGTRYGLMVGGGRVMVVNDSGAVVASAPQAPGTLTDCATALPAVLSPAVSASNSKIYFRDGDTQIRSLALNGQTAAVSSVPGGTMTVSSFSVSPDDARIAVVVEDMSQPDTITERLYVEDLVGGGHHADIYSATLTKGKGAESIWPMGWHQGNLVLAAVPDCSVTPVTSPAEWHVVNPTTGARIGTVPGTNIRCLGSFWQSPTGVACAVDNTTFVMDWTAKDITRVVRGIGPDSAAVSPAGRSVNLSYTDYPYASPQGPATEALNWGEAGSVLVKGQDACMWLDDATLLTPDSVIAYPSGTVIPLATPATCAGRFPGGL